MYEYVLLKLILPNFPVCRISWFRIKTDLHLFPYQNMSANANPLQFEDAFVTDINQKMKVPDKISFNPDANGISRPDWSKDSINMQVPERILVAGHHQHLGTRAPPREIAFDKSIIVTEPYPGDVRVATPPRTLTLDKYPYPDPQDYVEDEETFSTQTKSSHPNDLEFVVNSNRPATPPIGANWAGAGDSITVPDEVQHLRRQLAKLNRRVMSLELENINRLQREKFVLGFGVAYFLLKFVVWMSKD